jgi:hypothetical protein
MNLLLSLNSILAAEPDMFNITLTPHYYESGYELNVYGPNQTYDGISFEIKAINPFDYKIVNISVLETNPETFINIVNLNFNVLKARETKVLGKTNIIPVSDFSETVFSITLSGINENNSNQIIGYGLVNFNSLPKKNEVLSNIGNKIWSGNSIGGLWILALSILFITFVVWKYDLFSYFGYYKKKSKYKRMKGEK